MIEVGSGLRFWLAAVLSAPDRGGKGANALHDLDGIPAGVRPSGTTLGVGRASLTVHDSHTQRSGEGVKGCTDTTTVGSRSMEPAS